MQGLLASNRIALSAYVIAGLPRVLVPQINTATLRPIGHSTPVPVNRRQKPKLPASSHNTQQNLQ